MGFTFQKTSGSWEVKGFELTCWRLDRFEVWPWGGCLIKERIFINTDIPLYSVSENSIYKDGSFSFLQAVASGEVEGVTDAIVLQEILYSLIKKAGLSKGLAVFDFISCIVSDVFSITSEDIFKLRELVEKYPDSSVRDLLHLSVMLDNEVSAIYTADNSFDMFAEIVRMDPVKFLKKGGKKKERHIFWFLDRNWRDIFMIF